MKARSALFLAALALALLTPAWALGQVAGHINVVVGNPVVIPAGQKTGHPAVLNDPVSVGDRVVTGPGARVKLMFANETVLNLGENTEVVIDQQLSKDKGGGAESVYHLIQGKLRVLVNKVFGMKTKVESPTAVAGVMGTYFVVAYDPATDRTTTLTLEGQVGMSCLADRRDPYAITPLTDRMITTVDRGAGPIEPRQATNDEIRSFMTDTDVPPKPEIDLSSLSRKSLSGDPVAMSKSMGAGEESAAFGGGFGDKGGGNEGGVDRDPLAPEPPATANISVIITFPPQEKN